MRGWESEKGHIGEDEAAALVHWCIGADVTLCQHLGEDITPVLVH